MARLRNLLRRTWLHPSHLALRAIHSNLMLASHSAHGKLLDLGCGRKPYERLFLSHVDAYIGLDLPSSVYGRSHVDVFGSALHLPFASTSVGTILAIELLEHLPDTHRALSEIYRVLSSDGVLILAVPLCEPLHEEPRDYYRFTKYGLAHSLEEHRLAVEEISPLGGRWAAAGYCLARNVAASIGLPSANPPVGARMLLAPFVLVVCAAIQLLFATLDAVNRDERGTLGYLVVARKPA